MKLKTIISYILFTFLLFSCNKGVDWSEEENITFKSVTNIEEPVAISDEELRITHLNIAISAIEIIGERLQAPTVTIVKDKPLIFNFFNNKADELHNINIPIGTYESLTFKITLDESQSGLIVGELDHDPNPDDNQQLEIPLLFDKTIEIKVLNEENDSLILVDESLKDFILFFDTQKLFDSVTTSNWNALIQANQGQSEVDLTSLVGVEFLEEVNAGIEVSLSIKAKK